MSGVLGFVPRIRGAGDGASFFRMPLEVTVSKETLSEANVNEAQANEATVALGRRQMLLQAGASAGFVTLWLTGCGDSGGGGGGTKDDASVKDDAKVGEDGQVLVDGQVPDGNVPDGTIPDANVPDAHVPDYACIMAPTVMTTNSHSHAISIPMGDLTTIQQRVYTLTGGHTHTITVTVQNFNELLAGGSTVTVTSTADGGGPHTHTVTWNC
jgi:hypothetical protein